MDRRIIPARAGFTRPRPAPGPDPRDHPRSRGVYYSSRSPPSGLPGSSPLARGLRGGYLAMVVASRIIPARAGFTLEGGSASGETRDHPRSRGVYGGRVESVPPLPGSSPLARGLPELGGDGLRQLRIIPARAGFTPSPTGTPTPSRDHPRSRGVYYDPTCEGYVTGGSSPLARGLHTRGGGVTGLGVDHPRSRGVYADAGQVEGDAERIIPARAGFTRSGV